MNSSGWMWVLSKHGSKRGCIWLQAKLHSKADGTWLLQQRISHNAHLEKVAEHDHTAVHCVLDYDVPCESKHNTSCLVSTEVAYVYHINHDTIKGSTVNTISLRHKQSWTNNTMKNVKTSPQWVVADALDNTNNDAGNHLHRVRESVIFKRSGNTPSTHQIGRQARTHWAGPWYMISFQLLALERYSAEMEKI